MTPINVKYTPPIGNFPKAGMFKFLHTDQAAWDLGYLSWDFDKGEGYPDAHFSVNILQTLQFVIKTGAVDMAKTLPASELVRGMIKGPAPMIAKALVGFPRLQETRMFLAYGGKWLETVQSRSYLYREPYDVKYDAEVADMTAAMGVLSRLK